MSITLRPEEERDRRGVENLIREAFWNLYQPGCDEHLLVHNLRRSPAFVPELCFVATEGDTLVGCIFYSKSKVVNDAGKEYEALCMGPLAALPSHQRQGIGSALMEHTLGLAHGMGFLGIIIFGSPDYYHRFGFKSAGEFGITTSDGKNFDAFMALELSPGSLSGVTGRFHEDPVFTVDKDELELFEKQFPYKERLVTDTQFR